ncbi:MAG: hypothetical protein LPJ89_09375 [Hymenobacteraceae bacterium]|nr:hypothetical protein [Hymenobacteraceae bacterium]MDX5397834.1 hypothetical protein [Hymenobacteraceae bacterium]MDX5443976.1 hypothetical protein [Hymenobacteraceae bacterium]MDX5513911.1 hypothetical protein [Hymenobacteraceae bacterium]
MAYFDFELLPVFELLVLEDVVLLSVLPVVVLEVDAFGVEVDFDPEF